jgi:hypothetical protein
MLSRTWLCVTLAALPGTTACHSAAQHRANDHPAAGEPLSSRVLRAVGVPAALAAVRPEMTYAELVRARPASYLAQGIGREEQVGDWLAWYFFDTSNAPLDVNPPEPSAQQRMDRAEFRRLNLSERDGERAWQEAVVRARSVIAGVVTCHRFRIDGWTEKDRREGVVAYVPLDDAPRSGRRRIIIGRAEESPQDRAQRSKRDSLGESPVAFVVTAEVEPQNAVFSLMLTERVECPAAAGVR